MPNAAASAEPATDASGGGVSDAGERGMVTAETAMVIPFLLALTMTLVCACLMAITQVRLVDAAREGARMIARGDDRDAVEDGLREMTPERTTVRFAEGADSTTRVTVHHRARIDLPLVRAFSIDLEATAVSLAEDPGTESDADVRE